MRNLIGLMMISLMGAGLSTATGEDRLALLGPIGAIAYAARYELSDNDEAPASNEDSHTAHGTFGFKVGLLRSPDIGDFRASSDTGKTTIFGSPQPATRTIGSSSSFGLAMHLGLQLRAESVDVAFLLGGGALLNDDVDSLYTEFVIEPLIKAKDDVRIGLVLGLMNFGDTEWEQDSSWSFNTSTPDVEFKGGAGARVGLKLKMGNGDGGSFVCSISYMSFAYDVIDARHDPNKKWTANNDELDLSGVMFYVGGRF